MRETVLDVETTGLSAANGDKIIEIGAVELLNQRPTGRYYHTYINPLRDIPHEAVRIHGLTRPFLAQFRIFKHRASELLDFIGDSPVIAHNAGFDRRFLNYELEFEGLNPIPDEQWIDSQKLYKQKYPGKLFTLDAMCSNFRIKEGKQRGLHGGLKDAMLLAKCWWYLTGGDQHMLTPNEGAVATTGGDQHMLAPQATDANTAIDQIHLVDHRDGPIRETEIDPVSVAVPDGLENLFPTVRVKRLGRRNKLSAKELNFARLNPKIKASEHRFEARKPSLLSTESERAAHREFLASFGAKLF